MLDGTNDKTIHGIFWMLATMFFFVSLDALAKYLVQSYPTIQVTWGRFFFHVVLLIVWLNVRFPKSLRSAKPRLQWWRSILMLLTNATFFIGISTTPLATASTIMFLSPIFLTLLAIPLLGEKVGFRRWIGIWIGFIGSIIVVRPDSSGVSVGLIFLLVSAMCNALYQISTRQIRGEDSDVTSVIYTGLAGALVASAIVPFVWVQPSAVDWLLFAGLGVIGIVGHLCVVKAFAAAEASVLAPFSYSSLVWATLYGFVLFNELPDQWTLTGAALIITSGLYIFYRERRLAP